MAAAHQPILTTASRLLLLLSQVSFSHLGLTSLRPDTSCRSRSYRRPASTCARCRKPAVLAARGTTHCRDCFLSSFRNRFTKHIQPARTAAAAHGVLAYQAAALSASSISAQNPAATREKKPTLVVACSGGPASTALVHLVHQSLFAPPSDGTAVKSRGNRYSQFLPFDGCEVVFVDQSALPGHGVRFTGSPFSLLRPLRD